MGALIGAWLVAVGEGETLAEFVVTISRGEALALALLASLANRLRYRVSRRVGRDGDDDGSALFEPALDGKDVVVVGTLAAAAAAAAAAPTEAGVIGCPCRCTGEPRGAAMSATAAAPPGVTDPPIVTGTGGMVVGGTAGDPYGASGVGP